jgi:hypothetical protein
MKHLTTILTVLIFSHLAYSKKYYTLADGNWNNTGSVWSLNNSTPCGCNPGYQINNDTIIVSHSVTLTGNLNSSASGRIHINSSGTLASTTYDIFVTNSVILSYGSINIRSLNIGFGGFFLVNKASLSIGVSLENYGTFVLENSALHVKNGNITTYSGSMMQLTNNSYIQSLSGNLKNEGNIDLCSTCCIELLKGNVTNQSVAIFKGSGAVNVLNGNIKNSGSWDSATNYCSSGNDQGMTTPEKCIQTSQVCTITNVPLATPVISFEGFPLNQSNLIEWKTFAETHEDQYVLEHSENGEHWLILGVFPAIGKQNEVSDYSYLDSVPYLDLTYYRLTKYDLNQLPVFSRKLSVKNTGHSNALIFPNPSYSNVFLKCKIPNEYTYADITDVNGIPLKQIKLEENGITELILPEMAGHYFIQLKGATKTTVFTLVKY